jgi:hypothetical protein
MTVRSTTSRSNRRELLPTSRLIPRWPSDFAGTGGIFSDAIYVAIKGNAELIRDKTAFKKH